MVAGFLISLLNFNKMRYSKSRGRGRRRSSYRSRKRGGYTVPRGGIRL